MQNSFGLSLTLSVLVVLLSIIPLSLGRIKAGYSLRNMAAPRSLFDELPPFGKRAVWCHQNCWESISLHAPACLFCLIVGTESTISLIAALTHPVCRLLYIFAYILNIPIARGLLWAFGILSTLVLFEESLIKII